MLAVPGRGWISYIGSLVTAAATKMIIDPISAVVGGVSAGLGILQSNASAKAQQQEFLNQQALSDSTAKFNTWQAGLNARANNLNSQYAYWAATVTNGQQLAYTAQLRNYDLAQEIAQAQKVAETRTGAGTNYLVNSEALAQRFAEEGMQQAVAYQQASYRILQQSSAFQAMAGEGNSVDRIVNNYTRQIGDYQALASINEGLRKRQYKRDQLGQITTYLNQYNSQDFYKAQERLDPIAPFPPLPSLVTPAPPSMQGAAPAGISALNIGTAVAGGFNTYLSTASAIKGLR